jgi:hypothetical protein
VSSQAPETLQLRPARPGSAPFAPRLLDYSPLWPPNPLEHVEPATSPPASLPRPHNPCPTKSRAETGPGARGPRKPLPLLIPGLRPPPRPPFVLHQTPCPSGCRLTQCQGRPMPRGEALPAFPGLTHKPFGRGETVPTVHPPLTHCSTKSFLYHSPVWAHRESALASSRRPSAGGHHKLPPGRRTLSVSCCGFVNSGLWQGTWLCRRWAARGGNRPRGRRGRRLGRPLKDPEGPRGGG